MEISFCSHPNTNKVITTIFGTWHDSWAVVACAKFCCDMVISNWIRAKWNFHRIWIVMEKSLVKWAPGHESAATLHYNDVIMGAMASEIISLAIVYSTAYPDAVQRKHQSFASLAFVRGIHRWPVNSPHKGPETRKMLPFDYAIMVTWFCYQMIAKPSNMTRPICHVSLRLTVSSCICR